MKILITNDDGIDSPSLKGLAVWATRLGEVLVAAPKRQQSANSHAIDFDNPFEVKPVDLHPGIPAYAVDSTPADCVRFAYAGLNYDFDLLLSGINRGFNVGVDILYSGTVAALFEAGVSGPGKRAIAFSTDPASFTEALEALDGIWDFFEKRRLFDYGSLYNVNIPRSSQGIVITRQGEAYFKDHFEKVGSDLYRAVGYSLYKGTCDLTSDRDAALSGYTSITPMTVDRSDRQVYARLTGKDAGEDAGGNF